MIRRGSAMGRLGEGWRPLSSTVALVLLTPADLSIFHFRVTEKSLSVSCSLSALPASEAERHLATCSGAFQFLDCQRKQAHSSWVDIDLPQDVRISELACSQNPPHSFPQHPPGLDSKLSSSAKRGVICVSCQATQGSWSPTWHPDTCLPQPQPQLCSGQVGGLHVGTRWEQDGITRLHLFKLIGKFPVILNSWIFFSSSIHFHQTQELLLWLSQTAEPLGPSHITKAKWTLLRERHERQGGREGKNESRKPERVLSWKPSCDMRFQPVTSVTLSLPWILPASSPDPHTGTH